MPQGTSGRDPAFRKAACKASLASASGIIDVGIPSIFATSSANGGAPSSDRKRVGRFVAPATTDRNARPGDATQTQCSRFMKRASFDEAGGDGGFMALEGTKGDVGSLLSSARVFRSSFRAGRQPDAAALSESLLRWVGFLKEPSE
jgi:hypothetical protein